MQKWLYHTEIKTILQGVAVDTRFAGKLADGEARAEVIRGKSGISIVDLESEKGMQMLMKNRAIRGRS